MAENYISTPKKFNRSFDSNKLETDDYKIIESHYKENQLEQEFKKSYKTSIAQSTIPIPFSFEQRDKQLLQKKEKIDQKVMESNKTFREFHARPIPRKVLKSPKIKPRQIKSAQVSLDNIKTNKGDEESSTFKARPPTVLYTKPFVPKKESPKPIKISEFTLSSEKRAKDREKFECFLREKEAKLEEQKRLYEEKRISEEKKEIARLRKEAVRPAEPIRRYKEPKPVPAKPVTEPRSPPLSCMRKKLSF